MARSKPVLAVTGATGFVGRYFVQRIAREERFRIRCLVRKGSNISALQSLGKGISVCYGDITDEKTLPDAFKDVWGVVNLAGYREFWNRDSTYFYEVNERGAANVFRASLGAGARKVVHVSTPLVYGIPDQVPFNEQSTPGQHPSDYARSKYLGDQAGWRLYRQKQLPLTIVHLAAVIGAGDDKETMEVRRALQGRLPALVGANTTCTYLYVWDAAEAITRALLKDDSIGRSYLIGNQRATTRDYFTTIGRLANVAVPRLNIPESFLKPLAVGMDIVARWTGKRPLLPLDVLKTTSAGSLLFDPGRSIEALGMSYTPLEIALAESIADIQAVL
jgi:dihydroflavonol-4-reductase